MRGSVMPWHVTVLRLEQHVAMPIDQNGAEGMIAAIDGAAGDVERSPQKMFVELRRVQV